MKNKECGFEARERLGEAYWDDPRWKEVQRLRGTGSIEDKLRANGLVGEIRESWGVN